MANRFASPVETTLDNNGKPISGAKLNFYESGTTNPLDTFSDENLTSANPNPVIADSAGRFGDIWLKEENYRVVLTDAADVPIWTRDPVKGTFVVLGDDFKVSQQSPADLTVRVSAGTLFDLSTRTRVSKAIQNSAAVTPPAANPRRDIVHIDRLTGVIGITTGAEAASPVDPTIATGLLPLARLRLTPTTSSIDSTRIDDIRELENLGGVGPESLQRQSFTAFNDTGAVNAYVITPIPPITAYQKNQTWVVDIANSNTGASTMNISGLGARNIIDHRTGQSPIRGQIRTGINRFVDDGSNLVLMTSSAAAIARLEHRETSTTHGGSASAATFNLRRFTFITDEAPDFFIGASFIPYKTQTVNFTVGQVVTAASGGTGLIVFDSDQGATGTLTVINRSGGFADNSALTDPLGGSALVNGNLTGPPPFPQFYVLPGRYEFEVDAVAYRVDSHRLRVRNITSGTTLMLGSCERAGAAVDIATKSVARAVLNVTSPIVIEVQHFTQTARATDGLGLSAGSGETEVYADMTVRLIRR